MIFVSCLTFLIISRANITYTTDCTELGHYMVSHVRLAIECDKIDVPFLGILCCQRCSIQSKKCIFQGVLLLLLKLQTQSLTLCIDPH